MATRKAPGLPPTRRIRWQRHYRLVPSRYPPIDLFERVADPAEWELLAAIESLTNDRLREQIGAIALVPTEERLSGPGASAIMAAFTHAGQPSRFTAGSYGVYYACNRAEGALAEVAFHHAAFLARTHEGPTQMSLRTYVGAIDAVLHDVRGGYPEVHDPASYVASQALGAAVRAAGGNGIVFDSVRYQGASNLAVFRPSVLAGAGGKPHTQQGPHLTLQWNGTRFVRWIEMGQPSWQPMPAQRAG